MLRTGFGLLYSTVGLIQLSTLKVTKFKTKAKNIQSSNKNKQTKKTKTKKKIVGQISFPLYSMLLAVRTFVVFSFFLLSAFSALT